MNILITGASTRLSQELASALSNGHEVMLTDGKQSSVQGHFMLCALDYDDVTRALVRGMDVIIHSGEVDSEASASDQLDAAMRCTYNLLWAAWEEGVSRLIFLSSLDIMDKYDEDFAVTEAWRPVPSVHPPTLSYHLGEFVCKEFAREGKIEVACLRLGDMENASSTSALYAGDAVQAVEKALTVDFGPGPVGGRNGGPAAPKNYWNVVHIQSDVPNARFL